MDNSNASGGIGFWGLLQIVFIVLKLCEVIKWSWRWVLSPIWIGFVILLLILLIIVIWSKLNRTVRRKKYVK